MTNNLRLHRFIIFLLYVIISVLCAKIYCIGLETNKRIEILSLGAVLATFGAAIMALGSLFAADRYLRIKENIDILYREIYKSTPWRRWPFLQRIRIDPLLNNNSIQSTLSNPNMPFDVGTHEIEITIPTVHEDFFDLPILKNVFTAIRYRTAFLTKQHRDMDTLQPQEQEKKDKYFENTMAYECLKDVWVSIFVYRLSRYCLHSGVAVILSSVFLTTYYILHA